MSQSTEIELKAEIAKEIAKTLLSYGVGGGMIGALFIGVGAPLLDRSFSKSPAKNMEEAIKIIADKIVDDITAFVDSERTAAEIGTTTSALHDLRTVLQSAGLTIDLLIDMQLDPQRLEKYLLVHAPKEMRLASSKRSDIFARAIKLFSNEILVLVPYIPGFSLAFSRALLKKHDEIIRLLQANNQSAG